MGRLTQNDSARPPRVEVVAGLVLIVVYALGVALPANPDFDATFGIEAYRPFGWPVLLPAAAALLAVLLLPRFADEIEYAGAQVASWLPPPLRTPALALVLTALFVVLTDTSQSGDGLGVLHQVAAKIEHHPLIDLCRRVFVQNGDGVLHHCDKQAAGGDDGQQ